MLIPVAALGGLVYTPSSNFTGTDSFGWQGSDGTNWSSNVVNVNVTVQAPVQHPTVSSFSKSGYENKTLGFTGSDFSSHFSDPNAGLALTSVQIQSLPSHGTLTLNGSGVTASEWIATGEPREPSVHAEFGIHGSRHLWLDCHRRHLLGQRRTQP